MYDLIKTTTLCPGLVVTLVESPSLVFPLGQSVYTLMSFLLKVRTDMMAKTIRIQENNGDNQRIYAKNINEMLFIQGRVKAFSIEPSPTVEPCSCPLTLVFFA